MAPYKQTITALATIFTLFPGPQITSALQVTPNSPCSLACRDSPDLDASDPNSSNTRGTDITCLDAAYSSAAGTKFKDCMTCLQTSTFSQGSESDTMWFLYNLRYTVAYCVFGYPNATGIQSTPCSTSTACGMLDASMKHGLLDPRDTTAYSYCSAGKGEAMDPLQFESCVPCISAEGRTEYLANYFVALDAGCRQQPASGVQLGLNDTIFSTSLISIVDPTTLIKQDETPKQGLGTPVVVGIAAGGLVFLLVVAGFTFVCVRKRKNKQKRASAEADFYNKINNRHRSSAASFQCQTHMISPRFWPTVTTQEDLSTPVNDTPDAHASRSSILKPQGPDPYPEHDTTTTNTPYTSSKKATPLHPITTTIPPPPQAHTSPSTHSATAGVLPYYSPSDLTYRSPLSADSVRSTSALLPAIKPYVPAEHGVHISSPVSATTTTPGGAAAGTGTGMTPLLKSHAWAEREVYRPHSHQQQQQQKQQNEHQRDPSKKHITKQGRPPSIPPSVPPPPPPPPRPATTNAPAATATAQPSLTLKTSRSNGLLGGGGGGGKKSPKPMGGQGSPVETWEIQTAFAGPPKR